MKINQSSLAPQGPGKPGGNAAADGKIAQLEAQKAKLEQQVKEALKEDNPEAQAKAAAYQQMIMQLEIQIKMLEEQASSSEEEDKGQNSAENNQSKPGQALKGQAGRYVNKTV